MTATSSGKVITKGVLGTNVKNLNIKDGFGGKVLSIDNLNKIGDNLKGKVATTSKPIITAPSKEKIPTITTTTTTTTSSSKPIITAPSKEKIPTTTTTTASTKSTVKAVPINRSTTTKVATKDARITSSLEGFKADEVKIEKTSGKTKTGSYEGESISYVGGKEKIKSSDPTTQKISAKTKTGSLVGEGYSVSYPDGKDIDLEEFEKYKDDEELLLDLEDEDIPLEETQTVPIVEGRTQQLSSQITSAQGTTTTSEIDLKISYEELETNIETLKKAVAELKNAWQTETKSNLTKLENSWIGSDCKEYITKLNNMDSKVNNTISALELLCSTYEQARDIVQQSQTNAINQIANI